MKCEICLKEQAVQGVLCNTCFNALENVPEQKLEREIIKLMTSRLAVHPIHYGETKEE